MQESIGTNSEWLRWRSTGSGLTHFPTVHHRYCMISHLRRPFYWWFPSEFCHKLLPQDQMWYCECCTCFHFYNINLKTFKIKGTFVINFSFWLTSQGVIRPPMPLPILQKNLLIFELRKTMWESSQHISSPQEEHFVFINQSSIPKPLWDIASAILILLQREKHQVHTKSKYGKKTPSLVCLQKSEG